MSEETLDRAQAEAALLRRLWRRTMLEPNGCVTWQGRVNHGGYGYLYDPVNKRSRVPHRVIYELTTGPIPEGLTIDHLCRNTRCVNPEHSEPVTMRENVMRGTGRTALNAQKTHCIHGHPLSDNNLLVTSEPGNPTKRACRTCRAERDRRRDRARPFRVGPDELKTHCKRGHALTPKNSYFQTASKRECRACRQARERNRQVRRAALRSARTGEER